MSNRVKIRRIATGKPVNRENLKTPDKPGNANRTASGENLKSRSTCKISKLRISRAMQTGLLQAKT